MVNIARRNLFQEKLRFIISVGGVALAIMLILILNGFSAGLPRQINAYLDNGPGDLVVAQKDLRNFLGANSIVPLSTVRDIEKIQGVKKVIPIFSSFAVLNFEGKRRFSLLYGFDPKKGGGPWKMVEGRSNINDDEVIFDKVLARRFHLELGQKIKILGKGFTIVGFSGGTSSWMTGTFFVTFNAAAKQLRAPGGTAGFLLVSAADKSKVDSLKNEVSRKAKNLSVLTRQELAENDFQLFARIFTGPVSFMVAIAFLIGVMLVGLTIYTATVERAREYGVLKAIGTKNWKLYLVVFEQALISSVFGFFFGILLAIGASRIIESFAPQFLILIEWTFIAQVSVIALLIGIFASYIPVRTIARIDPAIAFRRGA